MKFISTKAVKNETLQMYIPFDSGLLKSITREDEEGYFTLKYDLSAILTPPFPIKIADSMIVAKVTHNNVYLSAILYADTSQKIAKKYEPYLEEGLMDCNLELSSLEREQMLIAIIQLLAKNI